MAVSHPDYEARMKQATDEEKRRQAELGQSHDYDPTFYSPRRQVLSPQSHEPPASDPD